MTDAKSFMRRAVEFTVCYEGSTRSAAIIRILLPFIIWWRWADMFLFYKTAHDPAMFLMSVAFLVGGICMVIGLATRVAVGSLTLMMLTWHFHYGHDEGIQRAIMSMNLVAPCVGLFFTDCGRSLSVDRWLAIRKAKKHGRPIPSERGSVWGLRLIAWQLSMMYLFGAEDKTDMQWIRGERMERYWMNFYGDSDYPSWPMAQVVLVLSAIGTVVLEYALAVGMWTRVGRKWLTIPGLLMHFGMFILLPAYQITLQMWLCYLAYFPADEVHDTIDELLGHPPSSGADPGADQPDGAVA